LKQTPPRWLDPRPWALGHILQTACLLASLALPAIAAADPVADPPPRWQDRVASVAPQELGEIEPLGAERIRETRARLGALLAGQGTEPGELAAAYGRLGALYQAHRLGTAAQLAFRNALVLDRDNFAWPYHLADLALAHGEAEAGLDYLAAAAVLDPGYPTLALRRGEALIALNRLAEARAAFVEAERDPAQRAAARYGLAQIDLLERDWQAAAAGFGKVLELDPAASGAHYPLGQALLRLGDRDAAEAHLALRGHATPGYPDPLIEALHSLQRGARFHFENAMKAVNRGDHAAAAEAFAAGLAEEPENARARASYARTLWVSGRQEAALEAMRQALADAPDETLPRFLLAVASDAAGDTDAAEAGYREVLRQDPSHDGALTYLGSLLFRAGTPAAAAEVLGRAVAAGSSLLPVYLQYWGALRASGASEADLLERLRAFGRRFPEPPVFRYLEAKLLATAQDAVVADADRALEIARELHRTQPVPPNAELLALVLAVNGEGEDAADLLTDLAGMARQFGAVEPALALESMAEIYRAGELPEPLWPSNDPLFAPPPVDAEGPMRNYPAAHPY